MPNIINIRKKKNPVKPFWFNWVHPGYHIRNSYASEFQYIRIIFIKLIRYISSIAPKGLISPQF